MTRALHRIRHVVLDLDGTIHLSGRVFPWTLDFLATLRELGIGHTFVTNNCSQSRRDYVDMLGRLGIEATVDDVYTSGQAMIDFLRAERPSLARLFVLGTDRLAEEFAEAGFSLLAPGGPGEPDAVIVGFDTRLSYDRLCRAAYWIAQGKPYLATHPDRVCPTDHPTLLVDCGAVCACLTSAAGRPPDVVVGKPCRRMIDGLVRRGPYQPAEIAIVGDRLYTDIQMAEEAGALGVLVLSGETNRPQAEACRLDPLIVENLGVFGRMLVQAHRTHRLIPPPHLVPTGHPLPRTASGEPHHASPGGSP